MISKQFEYWDWVIVVTWEFGPDGKWKETLEGKLNEYGAYGWELVCIKKVVRVKAKELYSVIFKREI